MRCVLFTLMGLTPIALVGCTEKLRGEAELAALLNALDEADAALQSVSDPSAAMVATEKVTSAHAKFKSLKVTDSEWKRLKKKFAARINRHEKYFE